ncbi:hypothetical protein TNIN_77891 [Trichonephila inaurata madagascariensis]|uniref:Uncharacterized protein n=1 Tax=Trichonephila inaurata madagascariensis TaxID=2747483 RepID=A0A8X6WQY8_9ARAC|nr:hypothetical protein TNIN_77891 [Trichonephila inaurata madagascariensis]
MFHCFFRLDGGGFESFTTLEMEMVPDNRICVIHRNLCSLLFHETFQMVMEKLLTQQELVTLLIDRWQPNRF